MKDKIPDEELYKGLVIFYSLFVKNGKKYFKCVMKEPIEFGLMKNIISTCDKTNLNEKTHSFGLVIPNIFKKKEVKKMGDKEKKVSKKKKVKKPQTDDKKQ